MESSWECKPHVCFRFEVEKIIGVSGEGSFQVQWAPAWVSKAHLVGCEHLIQDFVEQQDDSNIKVEAGEHLVVPDTMYELEDSRRSTDGFSPVQLEHEVKPAPDIHLMPDVAVGADDSFDKPPRNNSVLLHKSNNNAIQPSADEIKMMELSHFVTDPSTSIKKNHAFDSENVPSMAGIDWSVKPRNSYQEQGNSEWFNPINTTHHICNICDKEFKHQCHLNRHMSVHSGTKPYICPYCSKRFTRKDHLTTHVRLHTGDRLSCCPHCSKYFTRKDHLERHILTHTGDKPFACDECGRSFSDPSTLRKHAFTHTRLKPFSCGVCGKSFKVKTFLNTHLRVHKGLKPHHPEVNCEP